MVQTAMDFVTAMIRLALPSFGVLASDVGIFELQWYLSFGMHLLIGLYQPERSRKRCASECNVANMSLLPG
eukprot:4650366-Amphidinium_carterae.1